MHCCSNSMISQKSARVISSLFPCNPLPFRFSPSLAALVHPCCGDDNCLPKLPMDRSFCLLALISSYVQLLPKQSMMVNLESGMYYLHRCKTFMDQGFFLVAVYIASRLSSDDGSWDPLILRFVRQVGLIMCCSLSEPSDMFYVANYVLFNLNS